MMMHAAPHPGRRRPERGARQVSLAGPNRAAKASEAATQMPWRPLMNMKEEVFRSRASKASRVNDDIPDPSPIDACSFKECCHPAAGFSTQESAAAGRPATAVSDPLTGSGGGLIMMMKEALAVRRLTDRRQEAETPGRIHNE